MAMTDSSGRIAQSSTAVLIIAFLLVNAVVAARRTSNSRFATRFSSIYSKSSNSTNVKSLASLSSRRQVTTAKPIDFTTSQSAAKINPLTVKVCGLETAAVAKFDGQFCQFASSDEVSRATDGKFVELAPDDHNTTVYSAFYDYRVNAVKVVAMSSSSDFTQFKCQLYYRISQSKDAYVVIESTAGVRRMQCVYHIEYYTEISCALELNLSPLVAEVLKNDSLPIAVAIVQSSLTCQKPYNLLHINTGDRRRENFVVNEKRNGKSLFAVCGAPLHKSLRKTLRVIEFIEANALLGASQFYFYDAGVSPEVREALFQYESAKQAMHTDATRIRLKLLSWQLHSTYNFSRLHYYGQIAASADCFFRSLLNFDYLVYSDIDELLVPRQHKTWHQMIDHIVTTNGPAAAYVFSNYWFYPTLDKSALLTARTFRTMCPTGPFNRVKLIMKLNLIDMFEIHLLTALMPAAELNGSVAPYYEIPESVGMLHHYRLPPTHVTIRCSIVHDDYVQREFSFIIANAVDAMVKSLRSLR